MARKPLSADDIFDQLHGSSNSSLVFTGLIERVPNDEQSIRFSRATDDPAWIIIPTSAIERVQFVQTAQGENGPYPLVHVFFKEPQTDEGRAFAALAHLHRPVAQLTNDFAPASLAIKELSDPPASDCPPGMISIRVNGKRICVPDDRPH
jgi:hypothetical protein